MNDKCVCSCSDELIFHPKHLKFSPPRLDGNRLTAQAEIDQPRTPVHALIVSTVLPKTGQQEAKAEFNYLLADLEADFQIAARRDDNDLPDDPDPESSDDPSDILIRPVLHAIPQDREFVVAFEFIASVPSLPSPDPHISMLSGLLGGELPIVGGARANKGHAYRRSDGGVIHAKLTSLVGSEILYPGSLTVPGPGAGNSRKTHGRRIRVKNNSNYRCRYTLTGNFGLHVQVSAATRPVLAADRDRDTES